ncbi:MAG: alpha/beta hydrolase [Caldilineaceae bacterium]
MTTNPTTQTHSTVIPLWPNGAPGSEDWTQQEAEAVLPNGLPVVHNVTEPTLTAYLPDAATATGTAVIVCPGGAFHFLATAHEGTEVAQWLNARGIAAFMLKYRLLRTAAGTGEELNQQVRATLGDRPKMGALMEMLRPLILADGQQAVRLVRARAAEWGITPDRIGIMGFSAGGAVTSSVAMQYDADCRPDFAAVIYGAPPGGDLAVPADAPPLFLLCANDDEMAATRSTQLFADWRAASRSVEMHIYAQGGHGFGMRTQGTPSDHWIERFGEWLQGQGFGS